MDLDRLRKHYDSLSDEALLEIDPAELVEQAREVLQGVLAERGLLDVDDSDPTVDADTEEAEAPVTPIEYEADWVEDAATVFTFSPNREDDEAERVTAALEKAGIPHGISRREERGMPPQMDVIVPGKAILEATSILDRDVFNEHLEQGWRDHFASLSDEEFNAVDIRVLTAGWADRIERLTRAYRAEKARRGA